MNGKKLIVVTVVCAVFAGAIYFAYARWFNARGESPESLLRSLPPEASAVIYVDVVELRQEAILKNLARLSAQATVDAEYKQFVSETGFDYEKDLDHLGIAIRNSGLANHYFALADGKFDRRKIEVYLRKSGSSEAINGREIFHLAGGQGRSVSATFLSNERIAFTDAVDLNSEIVSGRSDAGHAEWTGRFARLAGSPVFALIRQDAAIGAILNAQAPGGFRSPQLVQLLNQLLWISIAGKTEGTGFRLIAEGECPSEMTMHQLSDFLNGITIMAQGGLNDPKLRQRMDPAERDAYVQLLNSVEVTRLDRGTSKSVRLAVSVSNEVWDKLANAMPIGQSQETAAPVKAVPAKKKTQNQVQPAER